MSNLKEILNVSPVFSSLEDTDIENLKPLFDKRAILPEEVLAKAKNKAEYFFLLGEGTLLLAMDEGKSVVLNSSGDFIGLELLSSSGVYKTTVSVLEKGTVFAVPRLKFLDIIREDSPAAALIMASWQEYLEATASFAKNVEDLWLPGHF